MLNRFSLNQSQITSQTITRFTSLSYTSNGFTNPTIRILILLNVGRVTSTNFKILVWLDPCDQKIKIFKNFFTSSLKFSKQLLHLKETL
jgi:hypothetical protein